MTSGRPAASGDGGDVGSGGVAGGLPAVPFNRWDLVHPAGDRGGPTASVVIAFFERPGPLAQVLGALAPQLRPGDEVVVVDDGSRSGHDEVAVPDDLPVRVLRRPDEGFRLAAARDEGARAATGDVLLFLDDDMVPADGWLDAHLRWHAAHDGLLTLGSRGHVTEPPAQGEDVRDGTPAATDVGPAAPATCDEGTAPRHIADYLAWTRDLTAPTDDLFRVCSGGNLGMRAVTYRRIGGFDTSASRYGGEDIELGYRAVQRGCLLVPVADARCRHLGRPGYEDPAKAADNRMQRAWMGDRIAHPSFRSGAPGRTRPVPSVRVVIDPSGAPVPVAEPAVVEQVVESVLASTITDLDVHVVAEEEGPIAELLSGDRRVQVGPAGEGPLPGWVADAPVHLLLGASTRLARGDVAAAVDALRRHTVGVVHLGPPAAPVASAVLTRAAARAAWAGADSPAAVVAWAEEVFGVRWVPTDPRSAVDRPAAVTVEDDLATIRYALRRLPAPAVHALAGGLRAAVRARRRLVDRHRR